MREDLNGAKQVAIVSLTGPEAGNVLRRPISAESAIMHKTDKVIALRGEYPQRG